MRYVLRDYRVPPEVVARMGAQPQRPQDAHRTMSSRIANRAKPGRAAQPPQSPARPK
jgi:hypothetical protein